MAFLLGDAALVRRGWVAVSLEIRLKELRRASIHHVESKNFWIRKDFEASNSTLEYFLQLNLLSYHLFFLECGHNRIDVIFKTLEKTSVKRSGINPRH